MGMGPQNGMELLLIDREVREHLDTVVIEDLILDPAFRRTPIHLECSYLQTRGATWQGERHLSIL